MTKVVNGLFVGSTETAKNEETLIANRITHILSVQDVQLDILKSPSRNYCQVLISDRDELSLLRNISEINDFIHSARIASGNVLVHSGSGVSTNVAVVAAYLMTLYEMDSRAAVSALQGLVPAAQPSQRLQSQLDAFGVPNRQSTDGSPGHPSPPLVTIATEHARLIQSFGTWYNMEEDQKSLEHALSSHNHLKASGVLLSPNRGMENAISPAAATADSVGTSLSPVALQLTSEVVVCAPEVKGHMASASPLSTLVEEQPASHSTGAELVLPPASLLDAVPTPAKSQLPSNRSRTDDDGDLFDLDGAPGGAGFTPGDENSLRPFDQQSGHSDTDSDAVVSSDACSEEDEASADEQNDIAGSMPVPILMRSSLHPGGSRLQQPFSSYRPSDIFDRGIDIAAMIPDGQRVPGASQFAPTSRHPISSLYASTAPSANGFMWSPQTTGSQNN